MALVLSGERPDTAAASFNPFRFLMTALAKARAGRAQRQALESLLDLEAYRLADLGIDRADLFDAVAAHRPTRLLADRRAARGRA